MLRWLLLLFSLLMVSACSKSAQQSAPAQSAAAPTTPAATPAATPNAMAVAPTLATPGAIPPPNGKDAPKNLPNVIGDRLYRALTLEEINQLPPATRDAILRAQGRLPASPTPKKK